jgi:hypothetical protein
MKVYIRCGFCSASVDEDEAIDHWKRGLVSRCRKRPDPWLRLVGKGDSTDIRSTLRPEGE